MKNIENAEQNDQIEQVEPPLQPIVQDQPSPGAPVERRIRSKKPSLPRQWTLHTSGDFKPFYYRLGAFPKQTYKGIQKWLTMGETDEQLSKEVLFTSEKYVVVDRVPKDIAKDYIKQNHYLKDVKSAEIPYGLFVFRRPEYKQMYLGNIPYPEKFNAWIVRPHLVGVAVYGNPVGVGTWNSISSEIKSQREIKELQRLYVADNILHAMKNGESYLISNSIKLIKQDHPDVKCLVSYAAPEMLHKGTIYQASNWKFQPTGNVVSNSKQAYSDKTKIDFDYGWTHSRSLSRNGITANEDSLKKHFGYPVAIKETSEKFRYIYILLKGTKLKEFIKGEKRYISDKFPTKKFIDEQKSRYSKMKVWYSENEFVEYNNNRDPEKFMIHPDELRDEKAKLESRIAEINLSLDCIITEK
jgi:hypothetical protein